MNPAYSVIFFTTSSGAGYGLLALLGTLNLTGLMPDGRWFGLLSLGLSLCLISAGLVSSTLHLGRPERSWRALSQWRSSWLSREGIVAVFTFLPAVIFGIGWIFSEINTGIFSWFGMLAALSALLTLYCTSMIYTSLRAIPAWTHMMVTPSYLVLGLATGALLLDSIIRIYATQLEILTVFAMGSLSLGWIIKRIYWRSIDQTRNETTISTATGLGGSVKVLDPPHTGTNYLQQEMGFRIGRKHSRKLRTVCIISLFILPIAVGFLLLLKPEVGPVVSIISVISAALGIVIERWLFFAEARHVSSLYYGN